MKDDLIENWSNSSNGSVARYNWELMKVIAVGCSVFVELLFTPVVAASSLQTSFNVLGTYTENVLFQNEDAEEDCGTIFWSRGGAFV